MAAPAPHGTVSRAAAAAMRRARSAYRARLRAVAGAMPRGSADQAVDVFDALQHEAFATSGWRGLMHCWFRETASLTELRINMTRPRPTNPLHGLLHDIRDAWRGIQRSPGTPFVIIATLALGVGMNTAVFSVVDALLFKQLPYAAVDRLVRVAEWPKTGGNFTASPLVFLAWKERATVFDRLEARLGTSLVHLSPAGPEAENAAAVTPGYFELLGVQPVIGRGFVDADATPNGDCKVVVSHRMWVRRLNADVSVVGAALPFAGRTCTLIGVLPADSVFDRSAVQVYAPLSFNAASALSNGRSLTVMGRLKPGVSIDDARAAMAGVTASINATRGRAGEGWTVTLTPWRDTIVRADSRTLAWTLFGAVSLVLLVACVNVAGLSLARSIQRRREWAVRLALGAGRWRALRALVVEGLLLAAAGEAAALVVGNLFLRLLTFLIPPGTVPPETVAALDGRALVFASVVSIAAALVCATAPAWRGSRANLADSLRDGRGTAGTRGSSRLHSSLLVTEIALAMVLVTGASLLAVSFARLVSVDPGFSPDGVLTLSVSLPFAKYPQPDSQSAYFDHALDALRRVPGVDHAAAVTSLPLGGWLYGTPFAIQELPPSSGLRPSAHIQTVSDDYFATLGIPIVAGRDFSVRDDVKAQLATIVNETFVRKFLPGQPAIGRHIVMDQQAGDRATQTSWEIVGVIHSVKTGGLAEKELAIPEIYVPFRQTPIASLYMAVRSGSVAPAVLAPAVMKSLQSVDPEVPASEISTMSERVGVSVRVQRFRTGLIGAFAGLAAILACVGVYGVRSRAVAARRREMGIRLAMGARPGDVTSLVVGEGMRLVVIGLAIGLAGSVAITRMFEQWLFATPIVDTRAITIAIATLGGAALAASWLPARRAARVDPLAVLRDE